MDAWFHAAFIKRNKARVAIIKDHFLFVRVQAMIKASAFLRRPRMPNHVVARTLRLMIAAALLGGSAWAVPASAQSYPDRPIKLISASAAGSTPDVLARLIADGLSPRLGQPVVVDNRPGAGQSIAIKVVGAADPDGYTLLLGNTGSLSINPALYPKLDFSVNRALVPVALV